MELGATQQCGDVLVIMRHLNPNPIATFRGQSEVLICVSAFNFININCSERDRRSAQFTTSPPPPQTNLHTVLHTQH